VPRPHRLPLGRRPDGIIGSGYRTQIQHVQWTDKVIGGASNAPVELTGVVKRYAGPLFRTFAVGPSPKMAADFEVVKDQLEAACAVRQLIVV
jgi:Xaa-Pro aminopeptidase